MNMQGGGGGHGKVQDTTNCYVANLPQDCNTDELKEMFSSYGTIAGARSLQNADGSFRGIGFVRFSTNEEATAAIKALNGALAPRGVNPLVVKFATRNNDKNKTHMAAAHTPIVTGLEAYNQAQNPQLQGYGAQTYQYPQQHYGQQMAGMHGQMGQSATNIYVQGLPRIYGKTELDVLFAAFGNIVGSRVLLDHATQESRGVGFVRMESHDQALRAVTALNGACVYYGQPPITVTFARENTDSKKPRRTEENSADAAIAAAQAAAAAGSAVVGVDPTQGVAAVAGPDVGSSGAIRTNVQGGGQRYHPYGGGDVM